MPLQPQESDKVDNCVRRVEAREEEKEVQAETESRERERARTSPASPRLALPCLVSRPKLDSTASKCQEQKNQRLTQFRIPCKVN